MMLEGTYWNVHLDNAQDIFFDRLQLGQVVLGHASHQGAALGFRQLPSMLYSAADTCSGVMPFPIKSQVRNNNSRGLKDEKGFSRSPIPSTLVSIWVAHPSRAVRAFATAQPVSL